MVKFNEALAYNKELRRQIDNLRRERFMFDKIYKKLEEELREKKNQMATIIELSNQAYEARDGAQLEIAAIQQSMAKDRGEFEEKMDQFNAIIQERNRYVGAWVPARAPCRRAAMLVWDGVRASLTVPATLRCACASAEQEEADTKRGNMTIQEEAELKTEVNMRAWAIAKDRAAMQVSIDKVQSYEEAFKKINVRRPCSPYCATPPPPPYYRSATLFPCLVARLTAAALLVVPAAGRHGHHRRGGAGEHVHSQ